MRGSVVGESGPDLQSLLDGPREVALLVVDGGGAHAGECRAARQSAARATGPRGAYRWRSRKYTRIPGLDQILLWCGVPTDEML